MNLVKLGDDRLERLGDTRTFVFEGETFMASQLNTMGRRLAGGLKSLGIGRGDHVVVSLSNSPEVFACFAAIWRLGAVIVPIMFLLGEDETRYILEHSDARAVITSADLIEKIHQAAAGSRQQVSSERLDGWHAPDKLIQAFYHELLCLRMMKPLNSTNVFHISVLSD